MKPKLLGAALLTAAFAMSGLPVAAPADAHECSVDMRIYDGQNGTLPTDEEEVTRGAFTIVNRNDTNDNGTPDRDESTVPGEVDLMKLELYKPAPAEGTAVLHFVPDASKVRVWTSPTKETELVPVPFLGAPALSFPVSSLPDPPDAKTVWVEGVEQSGSARDIQLKYTVFHDHPDDATPELLPCGVDHARATITWHDLTIDVDRDGSVEHDEDETPNEDTWSHSEGAILFVNVDDDDSDGYSDSVEFSGTGNVSREDVDIDAGDAPDITELSVSHAAKTVRDDLGIRYVLEMNRLDEVKAFHLFKKLQEGEPSIWGGPSSAAEVDITPHLTEGTTTTVGLEGLFFRDTATDAYGGLFPGGFDGELHFELRVEDAQGARIVDTVAARVSPLLLLPNTQTAQEVFAIRDPDNEELRTGIEANAGGMLTSWYDPSLGDQWSQDHVEIGYTEGARPGQRAHIIVQLPRSTQQAWPRKVLAPDVGLFRFRNTILHDAGLAHPCPHPQSAAAGATGPDSGEFGGNLEVSPPVAGFPRGRLIVGSTMSTRLVQFLTDQDVQGPPITLDMCWLGVGHIDETVGFLPTAGGFKIIVASPLLGRQLITGGDALHGIARPAGKAPLFARGGVAWGEVTRSASDHTQFVGSGFDRGDSFGYVRFYKGTAAGQVARITRVGSNRIRVDRVWRSPRVVVDPTAPDGLDCQAQCFVVEARSRRSWFPGQTPAPGDKFVLVEDTLLWDTAGGPAPPPALITVGEVRDDNRLKRLNASIETGFLAPIRDALRSGLGLTASGFVDVPSIYMGVLGAGDMPDSRTVQAFVPGLENFQPMSGRVFFPDPHGPENKAGQDVFEAATTARLPDRAAARFLEDWVLYHALSGEVHCGTAVRREPYGFKWWNP